MRILIALALVLGFSTASWADNAKPSSSTGEVESSTPAGEVNDYQGCSHSKQTS